jgi:hypothetical protein
VTIGDECPSRAETIWTGPPAVIRCVAWLCLTSWSRPSRTPAFVAQPDERLGQPLGVERPAELVAEEQITIAIGVAGQRAGE